MPDQVIDILGFMRTYFWIPIPVWILFIYWCYSVAYPLNLEARIRQGKSWIYLPRNWRGSRKSFAMPITFVLFALLTSSSALALSNLTGPSLSLALPLAVPCFALAFFIYIRIARFRFFQQRDAFFREYDLIVRQFQKDGKTFSENEIRNLAMYEHQNSLRQADEKGRLLKYLSLKAKNKKLPPAMDLPEPTYGDEAEPLS
jgi:hypothetical protein